jgi:Icc-related predicted phosphoesterase
VNEYDGHAIRLRWRSPQRGGPTYDGRVAVYVISDLHGAVDDMRKAVPEGATLVLLGDLINFIDYFTLSGILTEVFSVEAVTEVVALRTAGRLHEARAVMRRRSEGREEEVGAEIRRLVRDGYAEVFAALPNPTYLIVGNVDNPAVALSSDAAIDADGKVFDLRGERWGFVGGALPTPMHVAGEISEEAFRHKVRSLPECDVLCSHIPPSVPELCFDTVAGKSERGSDELLQYIIDVQPTHAYFGHIHQPLVSSLRIGRTWCVNVGYFRATKRAWRHPARST